jgi:hypothetical protein
MDVRSFMLQTGQELVAELVRATGTGYVIKNPLVAHMMNDGKGGVQLGFAPWSLLHRADVEIEIFDHGLLARPVDLEQQVADSYIQQQTGLILPPGGGKQILKG